METELIIESEYGNPKLTLYSNLIPNMVAQFAMNMLCTPGMLVSGVPDGEDAVGRAKMRLISEDELVKRAISVASGFYAEADKQGLLIKAPTYDEACEAAREKRGKN